MRINPQNKYIRKNNWPERKGKTKKRRFNGVDENLKGKKDKKYKEQISKKNGVVVHGHDGSKVIYKHRKV